MSFYNTFILDDDISDDKKKILNIIFKKSTLALIYGPAGTGKNENDRTINNSTFEL